MREQPEGECPCVGGVGGLNELLPGNNLADSTDAHVNGEVLCRETACAQAAGTVSTHL